RRDRERGGDHPAAQGGRDRRPGDRYGAVAQERRQTGRDGAGHGVHQDHPGEEVTAICPNGHTSESEDYCDTCGAPISSSGAPPQRREAPPPAPAPAPAAVKDCPNCGEEAAPDALFCENCGYDFTTGTMPRATTPETPAAPPPDPAPIPPPIK